MSGEVKPEGFGKRTLEFRDRLYYLCNRRGITMQEAHLAYLASQPKEFWIVEYPWKRKNMRFYIELVLGWFWVLSQLENSVSREDFLAKFNLPSNTTDLIPKTVADYDDLEIALGRRKKPVIQPKKP